MYEREYDPIFRDRRWTQAQIDTHEDLFFLLSFFPFGERENHMGMFWVGCIGEKKDEVSEKEKEKWKNRNKAISFPWKCQSIDRSDHMLSHTHKQFFF